MALPPAAKWIKSTFCANHSCLEAALLEGDIVAVRDGKNVRLPHLELARGDWNAFLDAVAAGEFKP